MDFKNHGGAGGGIYEQPKPKLEKKDHQEERVTKNNNTEKRNQNVVQQSGYSPTLTQSQ